MITSFTIGMMFVVGAGAVAETRPAMKCPAGTPVLFPDAPEIVYVLDGRPVPREVTAKLDSKTIESVHVICATQLYRDFDLKAKRSGMLVFTVLVVRASLNASLDSLGVLQRAYFASHGAYANTLADLAWPGSPNVIAMQLTVSERGSRWYATATHRYVTNKSAEASSAGAERVWH